MEERRKKEKRELVKSPEVAPCGVDWASIIKPSVKSINNSSSQGRTGGDPASDYLSILPPFLPPYGASSGQQPYSSLRRERESSPYLNAVATSQAEQEGGQGRRPGTSLQPTSAGRGVPGRGSETYLHPVRGPRDASTRGSGTYLHPAASYPQGQAEPDSPLRPPPPHSSHYGLSPFAQSLSRAGRDAVRSHDGRDTGNTGIIYHHT